MFFVLTFRIIRYSFLYWLYIIEKKERKKGWPKAYRDKIQKPKFW